MMSDRSLGQSQQEFSKAFNAAQRRPAASIRVRVTCDGQQRGKRRRQHRLEGRKRGTPSLYSSGVFFLNLIFILIFCLRLSIAFGF